MSVLPIRYEDVLRKNEIAPKKSRGVFQMTANDFDRSLFLVSTIRYFTRTAFATGRKSRDARVTGKLTGSREDGFNNLRDKVAHLKWTGEVGPRDGTDGCRTVR